MAKDQLIGGVCYVHVNNQQLMLRGNLRVSTDTVERTGVAGQDGVHGYTEAPRVSFIEGDFTIPPSLSLQTIQDWNDVTVTAELKGRSKPFRLRNAWTAGARELDTTQGQASIRFEGTPF